MRAKVVIVDEMGNQYEGELNLVRVGQRRLSPGTPARSALTPVPLNFDMNERAFAKKHATGLSGPKKFALLIAYLARGDQDKQARLGQVEKLWNKMKALLGGPFNHKYPNKAKEYGWVDNPKAGVYVLRAEWRNIFERGEANK